jgi:hypothetical protein
LRKYLFRFGQGRVGVSSTGASVFFSAKPFAEPLDEILGMSVQLHRMAMLKFDVFE